MCEFIAQLELFRTNRHYNEQNHGFRPGNFKLRYFVVLSSFRLIKSFFFVILISTCIYIVYGTKYSIWIRFVCFRLFPCCFTLHHESWKNFSVKEFLSLIDGFTRTWVRDWVKVDFYRQKNYKRKIFLWYATRPCSFYSCI